MRHPPANPAGAAEAQAAALRAANVAARPRSRPVPQYRVAIGIPVIAVATAIVAALVRLLAPVAAALPVRRGSIGVVALVCLQKEVTEAAPAQVAARISIGIAHRTLAEACRTPVRRRVGLGTARLVTAGCRHRALARARLSRSFAQQATSGTEVIAQN
ncbi:MAG TPA: hypothetical protein VJH69_01765 [Candidatus Paceibacterota bacterium]